jgi:hypothetical protein
VLVHIVHKPYISLMSFLKPYERDVNFVNNVIITLSNGQMTNIKVEDHDKLCNTQTEHYMTHLKQALTTTATCSDYY